MCYEVSFVLELIECYNLGIIFMRRVFRPCIFGTCIDKLANYYCECNSKYGGKNCSVELIGCNRESACQNNGTCKPYLIGETEHRFNCTCPSGFHGATCEKVRFLY